MKRVYSLLVLAFLLLVSITVLLPASRTPARADRADVWWDKAWPYRIPVSVSGIGVAQVVTDFTAAFDALGLNGALLDVRSRVGS